LLLLERGLNFEGRRNVPGETREFPERLFRLEQVFSSGRATAPAGLSVDHRLIDQRIDRLTIVPADGPGRGGHIDHHEFFLRISPPIRAAGPRPGELPTEPIILTTPGVVRTASPRPKP